MAQTPSLPMMQTPQKVAITVLNLIKKHRFSTIIAISSYHIPLTAHTFCHCRRPHHGSWHPHADLANYKSSPLRMIPLQQDEVEHPWSDLPPLPFRTQYHHHQFHQESHHSCTSSSRAHSARKYRLRKANRCAWLHPNGCHPRHTTSTQPHTP